MCPVPVLWLQVVEPVIKSAVESSLYDPTDDVEGKKNPHHLNRPVKEHVQGETIVPDTVQDPGPTPSAQV